MSAYAIPLTQSLPWYVLDVTLSEVAYILDLRFNTRRQRWALSISDAAENVLAESIPLLIDRDLLAPYRTLPVPSGVLVCADKSGRGQQPTAASFFVDHALYYVEVP